MRKIELQHQTIVSQYVKSHFGISFWIFFGFSLLLIAGDIYDVIIGRHVTLTTIGILVIAGSLLWVIITQFIGYLNLRKGNYRIVTDVVVRIEGEHQFYSDRTPMKPIIFHFHQRGKYELVFDSYNKEIKSLYQDQKDLDRTIEVGDPYLLVMVNKKILGIYNTRIFNHKEDV